MAKARFNRARSAQEALDMVRKLAAQQADRPVSGRVYEDEPIIRTGAQFKRDAATEKGVRPGSSGDSSEPHRPTYRDLLAAAPDGTFPTLDRGGSQRVEGRGAGDASDRAARPDASDRAGGPGGARGPAAAGLDAARGPVAAGPDAARFPAEEPVPAQFDAKEERRRERARIRQEIAEERDTRRAAASRAASQPPRPITIDDLFEGLFDDMPVRGGRQSRDGSGRGADRDSFSRVASYVAGTVLAKPPLPEPYRRMRELSRRPDLLRAPSARIFYEQARLMADQEDDYAFNGRFYRYFPSYRDMDDDQLRGYFSWRTKLRAGRVDEALDGVPISFLFVYIYELLCGVGCEPGEDGLRALQQVRADFACYEDQLAPYLNVWLFDYCIYHGLDVGLLGEGSMHGPGDAVAVLYRAQQARLNGVEPASAPSPASAPALPSSPAPAPSPALPSSPAPAVDQVVTAARRGRYVFAEDVLSPTSAPSDEELFAAILACCSRSIASSRFFRERPDEARDVVCGVFRRMVDHCAKHRKTSLDEGMFGMPACAPYEMFRSALFWSPTVHETCVVRASETEYYVCDRGFWYRGRLVSERGGSAELSDIVRAVDCRLRANDGYAHPLKERRVPKYLDKIISDEIERRRAWVEAHRIPELVLDRSALGGIRSAAASTREALLVDEEREGVAELESRLRKDGGTPWAAATADTAELPAESAQGISMDDGATSTAPANARPSGVSGGALGGISGRPPSGASGVAPSRPPSRPPSREDVKEPGPRTTQNGMDAHMGAHAEPNGLLAAHELAVIEALLAGAPVSTSGSTMLSVVVDGINEKLYDEIGDTAIEWDEDVPVLVEDYIDDVRELLGL